MIMRRLPVLLAVIIVASFANSNEVKTPNGGNSHQSNVILENEEVTWNQGWSHAINSQMVEGCRNSNMCCQGKVNNCFARGSKLNGEFDKKCFCDSQCLTVNDCCWDYKNHCPASDCLLDTWGEWGDCDSKCGFGVRQRVRAISKEPKNGGKPCEATNQKQVCEGTHCKLTRDSDHGNELRETGRILPLEFSRWRNDVKYDPYMDIRRNIFHSYQGTPKRITICTTHVIKNVHASCKVEPVPNHFRALKKGSEICVECHPTAKLDNLGGRCFGQGVLKRETRWSIIGKLGCRGTWVMESRKEECTCGSKYPNFSSYSFI